MQCIQYFTFYNTDSVAKGENIIVPIKRLGMEL